MNCDTDDTCMFWRFFKNDTVTECLHLKTNYHQDCISFAGPTLSDIGLCFEVDLNTCDAYIGEECMLFSSLQADCRVIGGPKTAPPLAECP